MSKLPHDPEYLTRNAGIHAHYEGRIEALKLLITFLIIALVMAIWAIIELNQQVPG